MEVNIITGGEGIGRSDIGNYACVKRIKPIQYNCGACCTNVSEYFISR